MKKMGRNKFKQTETGIPEGWTETVLGEVAEPISQTQIQTLSVPIEKVSTVCAGKCTL
jgi:hypothetical protein